MGHRMGHGTGHKVGTLNKQNKTKQNEINTAAVMKCYEDNIGLLTPRIVELLEDYMKDFSCEMIIYAIELATTAGKRNFNYIAGILNSWSGKGIKTLIEAKSEKEQWSKSKGISNENSWDIFAQKMKEKEEKS